MRTLLTNPTRPIALVALLLVALVALGVPAGAADADPFAVAQVDPADLSVTLVGTVLPPVGESYTALNRPLVRATSQEGEGATTMVAADGSFSVGALPGAILITVIVTNPAWDDPTGISGLVYFAEAGDTVTVDADPATAAVDPIQLVVKRSTIGGQVTVADTGAPAPAGIPVRAWRLDGAEYEETSTNTDGSYSLRLVAGAWMVRAVPEPDPQAATAYVPAEPPRRVNVADGATATQDLSIATADILVRGQAVDSVTLQPATGLDGRANSLYRADTGRPAVGPTAPLEDGAFTLRLASSLATTYTIGLYLPADAGYTAEARHTAAFAPGTTQITIPVTPINASIAGSLVRRDGTPLTGVAGAIYGFGESGAWARTRVNPATGAYTLPVSTSDRDGEGGTTWAVRAFVDPSSGYIVQRPRAQRVFVPFDSGGGADVTGIDFTTVALSEFGVVRGRVVAPGPGAQPIPLPGVRVAARPTDDAGGPTRWDYTDRRGEFTLRLPAGGYALSAHRGPAHSPANLLVEPAPLRVVVAAQATLAGQELVFRAADAVLTGTVTLDGVSHPALVRARSSDGATVAARAGDDGAFRLRLLAGLTWSVEAVSSDQSTFLRSARAEVTPAVGANPPLALVLAPVDDLPETLAFAFDPALDQIFELGNGSRVEAPAGAFAAAGDGVLTVRPLPEVQSSAGAEPVSFAYRLHAYVDRAPVFRFLSPITLVIPFSAEQLAALGVTPEQLVPAYWDEASASWKPVETVAVITDDTGGGEVRMSVEHFTDYALVTSAERLAFLPSVTR